MCVVVTGVFRCVTLQQRNPLDAPGLLLNAGKRLVKRADVTAAQCGPAVPPSSTKGFATAEERMKRLPKAQPVPVSRIGRLLTAEQKEYIGQKRLFVVKNRTSQRGRSGSVDPAKLEKDFTYVLICFDFLMPEETRGEAVVRAVYEHHRRTAFKLSEWKALGPVPADYLPETDQARRR